MANLQDVCLATPTHGPVAGYFAFDLARMVRETGCAWLLGQGSILSNIRTHLVRAAQHRHSSHILFLDSDMRFPPDAAQRLLNANKPIIGANYRQRISPRNTAKLGEEPLGSQGVEGIAPCRVLGFGVCLIRMEVFEQIEAPWFLMPYDPITKQHLTDDAYFFKRVAEAGIEVWVDHDLSREVRHLGEVGLEVL